MKLSGARRWDRRGFTLIELLIVVAIISVLLSLISAAVWKAVVTANRVRNQNEISQLATAVENFKQKFGIYPPSRILLGERITDYFRDGNGKSQPYSQFHLDSYAMLTTIFPRLDFSKSLFIDWDGNRLPSPPVVLEGDQCLVFFLGGIPQVENGRPFCSGFSTNPVDPTYHVRNGGDTIPPFFEFDSSRLVAMPQALRVNGLVDGTSKQGLPGISSSHFSFLDTYGNVPYAYFSSYKTRNGYNRYATILWSGKPSSDCASLGVWPYAEGLSPSARYLNPNTFQIISAGANGARLATSKMKFGRGTEAGNTNAVWTPALAGNSQAIWGYDGDKQAGADDQSNFYDSTLATSSSGS
jgi:general secretion pathway protein G